MRCFVQACIRGGWGPSRELASLTSAARLLVLNPRPLFFLDSWVFFVPGKSMQIICLFTEDPARGPRASASTPTQRISASLSCGLRGLTGTLQAGVYHQPYFLPLCHQQDFLSLSVNREWKKKQKGFLCNYLIFFLYANLWEFFFLLLTSWGRAMVPLVTWVQEAWQMISCCVYACTRAHTHIRERQGATWRKLAPDAKVYILNIERILKDQLKRKHPSNQDICCTVF